MSAPRLSAEKGIFKKACTASVCRSALDPAAFKTSDTAFISVTAPVSLFTSINETSTVSSLSTEATSSTRMAPLLSGFKYVTSKPFSSMRLRERLTASCSTLELIMCFPVRCRDSAPLMIAVLSLSVPHEVKMSSSGAHPRAWAISFLDESRSFLASLPFVWVELGFP